MNSLMSPPPRSRGLPLDWQASIGRVNPRTLSGPHRFAHHVIASSFLPRLVCAIAILPASGTAVLAGRCCETRQVGAIVSHREDLDVAIRDRSEGHEIDAAIARPRRRTAAPG